MGSKPGSPYPPVFDPEVIGSKGIQVREKQASLERINNLGLVKAVERKATLGLMKLSQRTGTEGK
jgi:hypothetical protein